MIVYKVGERWMLERLFNKTKPEEARKKNCAIDFGVCVKARIPHEDIFCAFAGNAI